MKKHKTLADKREGIVNIPTRKSAKVELDQYLSECELAPSATDFTTAAIKKSIAECRAQKVKTDGAGQSTGGSAFRK